MGVWQIKIKRCHATNTKHHVRINHIRKVVYSTQWYRNNPLNNNGNLLQKTFTYNEFKLLNKDLNFRPTPRKDNKSKYTKYTKDFIRRIKLKAYYKTTQLLVIQFTKSSSEKKSTSKKTHLTVDTFVAAFKKELEIEEKVIK